MSDRLELKISSEKFRQFAPSGSVVVQINKSLWEDERTESESFKWTLLSNKINEALGLNGGLFKFNKNNLMQAYQAGELNVAVSEILAEKEPIQVSEVPIKLTDKPTVHTHRVVVPKEGVAGEVFGLTRYENVPDDVPSRSEGNGR